MRRYLLISTISIVFSEAALFHAGVDVLLCYFVVLANIPILFLFWDFSLPKAYAAALAYLVASGAIEAALGPDTLAQYSKEVTGIIVVSFYFYLFFRTSKWPVLHIFGIYASAAFWVSLLGILIFVAKLVAMHEISRVQSVLLEPAHFATIVLPALYYYASTRAECRFRKFRLATIFSAVVLSVSAVGFLGLLLSAALLLRKKPFGLLLAPLAVGALALVAYSGSEDVRMRVDDTFRSITSLEIAGANLSTYALLSNAYVALRAVEERPIFGYGVGGHVIAHAKYIGDLPEAAAFGEMSNLNAQDANSLFLRTVSEFGLVGVAFLFLFLLRFWAKGTSEAASVNSAVFVYLFLYLLRGGNWFSPELYFFVWTYVLTGIGSRAGTRRPSQARQLSWLKRVSLQAPVREEPAL